MNNNQCTCSTSCAFIGTAVSLIAGIVVGLLFFFGVIPFVATPLIVTLIVGAVAFAGIAAAFLFARDCRVKECLCRLRGVLFVGSAGTFLASLLAQLVTLTIGSVFAAILIGLIAFFLILLISAIICLAACAADCE